MTDINPEEIIKATFSSNLIKHLKTTKVIIPLIITLLVATFGAGLKVEKEVGKVKIAKIEAKHIAEINEMNQKIFNLQNTCGQGALVKQQFGFILLYLDYILAKNTYVQKGGERNLMVLKNAQRRFANYVKNFRNKLIKNDTVDNIDVFFTMSSTSIKVGGKDWPIPQDILILVEGEK